jgi:hypothetical protein
MTITDTTIAAIVKLALERVDPREELYNFGANCHACGGWDVKLVRALVEASADVLEHEAKHAEARRLAPLPLRSWNVATDEAINTLLADDSEEE